MRAFALSEVIDVLAVECSTNGQFYLSKCSLCERMCVLRTNFVISNNSRYENSNFINMPPRAPLRCYSNMMYDLASLAL